MPTWDDVAEKQRDTLQGAGVIASDAAAIAALLAGKSGRVKLALLDRAELSATEWRKVLLSARLPAAGVAPGDWSISDEDGNVLDEPPDTPGGLLLHDHGNHSLVDELGMGYYRIAGAVRRETRLPLVCEATPKSHEKTYACPFFVRRRPNRMKRHTLAPCLRGDAQTA